MALKHTETHPFFPHQHAANMLVSNNNNNKNGNLLPPPPMCIMACVVRDEWAWAAR